MQDTLELEFVIGSRVRCAGEECGVIEFVVVDPVADRLTHLVVRPDGDDTQARLVPVHIAMPGPDGVELNCTRARFEEFEPAVQTSFPPGSDRVGPVRRGDRVHATDGEIGRVQGLVVVPPDSAVTHVLLDEGHLWGRKRVAIPIRDVTGIDAEGVAVRLTKADIKDLPPVDVEGS